MKIGTLLPQGRLQLDRGALRTFAQAAEDLGYAHVASFDHVLGADHAIYSDRELPYTIRDPFHEPLTLFSFLAGCAPRLGFCTSILISPQRQTALVAKQAAEVDLLSGGQLRIGVGTGWNDIEYEALGVPWASRGRRLDEQIEVLRLLWTQPSVSYAGEFHSFNGAGINPLPAERPIPIWVGGKSDAALHRAALLGDGYLVPGQAPGDTEISYWAGQFDRIRSIRRSAGLDRSSFGFEARPTPMAVEDWSSSARLWADIGATHLCVTTLGNLRGTPRDRTLTVDDHIQYLVDVRDALEGYFEGSASQIT